MWGAAGMVYEVEEPDAKDPNYDEVAQVSTCHLPVCLSHSLCAGFLTKKVEWSGNSTFRERGKRWLRAVPYDLKRGVAVISIRLSNKRRNKPRNNHG